MFINIYTVQCSPFFIQPLSHFSEGGKTCQLSEVHVAPRVRIWVKTGTDNHLSVQDGVYIDFSEFTPFNQFPSTILIKNLPIQMPKT